LTQTFVESSVDFEVAHLLYSWSGDCHTRGYYLKRNQHKLTWYTLNPSILRVGTVSSVEIMWAVDQSGLSCCAGNIIKSYDYR